MTKRSVVHKCAKDLAIGDRVQISDKSSPGQTAIAEVIALVPSVQIIRRPVILATFRNSRGREIHRMYMEGTPINLVSEVS